MQGLDLYRSLHLCSFSCCAFMLYANE
uniref:Uncharacterized protein n=1 Tax=Arundo donax TaxID=35708 RepID=A0A0A9A579_ARUDO